MAVFPPVLRPPLLSEPLLEVLLGRLPADEDEEVAAEEVPEEPGLAVVVEGVYTEVTTTVTGASLEAPSPLAVTMEVKSWVEGGCDEAETIDVTTLVDDGSTVTVLAMAVAEDKTSDDTDDATADEKDDSAC